MTELIINAIMKSSEPCIDLCNLSFMPLEDDSTNGQVNEEPMFLDYITHPVMADIRWGDDPVIMSN